MRQKVLCVSPDAKAVKLRCEVLDRAGFVSDSSDPDVAIERLLREHFDAVLLAAQVSSTQTAAIRAVAGPETIVSTLERGDAGDGLVQKVRAMFSPGDSRQAANN
ncbi:MAG TPA: hypothetical protein VGC88_06220 [Terriglobales bacterium]|jgi:hypothetical protein